MHYIELTPSPDETFNVQNDSVKTDVLYIGAGRKSKQEGNGYTNMPCSLWS